MDLEALKRIYTRDVQNAHYAQRELAEARKYYDGEQLSNEVLAILESRNQPPIVENIFKLICNKILGYKSQNLQEIKVLGRQERDKPLANVLQDLVRVFSDDFSYLRAMAKRDKDLILGFSVIELEMLKDRDGNFSIKCHHIPNNTFFVDAFSSDQFGADANSFHKLIYADCGKIKEDFGFDIDPEDELYKRRAKLRESWVKESGEWNRYFWDNTQIYRFERRPFKNNIHPFCIAKYYVDNKNQYYGIFRDIKPLQDYINFAENRMNNMLGSMKAFFEEDAVLDKEDFINNAVLDNAIVEVRSGALKEGKMQFVQHHNDIQALTQKTNEKRNLAKILSGLNDEALGVAVNRQSGVAISQRRDAGLMGLQDFIRASDEMDKDIFYKVIDLIQHYFTKKQIFRIIDEEEGYRYFSINDNEDSKIRIGSFDLILNTQLRTQGREERFAHWSEMIKTIASVRPDIVPDLLPLMLKDTDSPIADDLKDLLKTKAQAQEANAQKELQAQQIQTELALNKEQAEIAEKEAKAKKYSAQADLAKSLQDNPQATKKGQDLR